MLPTSTEPYSIPLFIFCAMPLIMTKNEALTFVRIFGTTTANCLEYCNLSKLSQKFAFIFEFCLSLLPLSLVLTLNPLHFCCIELAPHKRTFLETSRFTLSLAGAKARRYEGILHLRRRNNFGPNRKMPMLQDDAILEVSTKGCKRAVSA